MKKPALYFGTILLSLICFQIFVPRVSSQETPPPVLTLWQMPNSTKTQMMGYILKTSTGKLLVIDGGMPGDAPYLLERIREFGNGHVDAWFLTHCHGDHYGALSVLLTEKHEYLTIDNLYFSFPPAEWLDKYEPGGKKYRSVLEKGLKDFKAPITTKANDVYRFDNITVTVLNDYNLELTSNPINNSSIVFRVDTGKTSLLFLGDLGKEAGDALLNSQPELLKCDIVQMAHHGQQGVDEKFYQHVNPRICLWPTPDWLWDNNSGNGYDTGPWKTLETRAWMEKLNIEANYIEKDGLIKLEIE